MRAAARTMPQHYAKTESRCGVVSEQLQARRACGKCCWSAAGTLARALVAAAEQPAPADGRQASIRRPDIQAALITALSRKPTCSRLGSGAQTTVFHAQIAQNFLRGALPRTPLGLRPRPHLGLSSPSVPTAGRFPWHGRPRLLLIVSVTKSTVTLWFRPPP